MDWFLILVNCLHYRVTQTRVRWGNSGPPFPFNLTHSFTDKRKQQNQLNNMKYMHFYFSIHKHYMHSADTFEMVTRLKIAVRGQICPDDLGVNLAPTCMIYFGPHICCTDYCYVINICYLQLGLNLKLIQISFNTSIN